MIIVPDDVVVPQHMIIGYRGFDYCTPGTMQRLQSGEALIVIARFGPVLSMSHIKHILGVIDRSGMVVAVLFSNVISPEDCLKRVT